LGTVTSKFPTAYKSGDARMTIVGDRPPGFAEFGGGVLMLAHESIGGRGGAQCDISTGTVM
jgi:hypothetical protein